MRLKNRIGQVTGNHGNQFSRRGECVNNNSLLVPPPHPLCILTISVSKSVVVVATMAGWLKK